MLPADWLRRCDRERRLAPLTTWRIGGPAEFYLEPHTVEELAGAVGELRRIGLPYRIIGGGSNLLISDRGVRGAVISLARLKREKAFLTAEEYFLIGCHFAERPFMDRIFGGDILTWVAKTFPEDSAAQAAIHKLEIEGFPPPPQPRIQKKKLKTA